MNKQLEHLKYLIFNDACSMSRMGSNHNAMDRSCCYDLFLDHIASPIFSCHYNVARERFLKEYNRFVDTPDMDWGPGGIVPGDTNESVLEYATEYANKAYQWLMEKHEKNSPCESTCSESEQEIEIE